MDHLEAARFPHDLTFFVFFEVLEAFRARIISLSLGKVSVDLAHGGANVFATMSAQSFSFSSQDPAAGPIQICLEHLGHHIRILAPTMAAGLISSVSHIGHMIILTRLFVFPRFA